MSLIMLSQARLYLLPFISLSCGLKEDTRQGAMEEELVCNNVSFHLQVT
jgi:hypothetical protein